MKIWITSCHIHSSRIHENPIVHKLFDIFYNAWIYGIDVTFCKNITKIIEYIHVMYNVICDDGLIIIESSPYDLIILIPCYPDGDLELRHSTITFEYPLPFFLKVKICREIINSPLVEKFIFKPIYDNMKYVIEIEYASHIKILRILQVPIGY